MQEIKSNQSVNYTQLPNDDDSTMKKVVIMGAGIAGCMSALSLAEDGWKVNLFERESDTLSGSSGKTPGRLSLGFHYSDKPTAERMLLSSIEFVRYFKDKLGQSLFAITSSDKTLRNGRYYIMKNSTFNIEKVKSVYEHLKVVYKDQCEKKYPWLEEFFGKPDQFYEWLDSEELVSDHSVKDLQINLKNLEACVITRERLLNWEAIQMYIRNKLKEHVECGRIKISYNATTKYRVKDGSVIVECDTGKEHTEIKANFLINATWHNSEGLDIEAGTMKISELNRTNRLKAIVDIKLPKDLRHIPSMFFCFGDHCMLSNLGNGFARITYAPITNVGNFEGAKVSDECEMLLRGNYKNENMKLEKILPYCEFREKKLKLFSILMIRFFNTDLNLGYLKSRFKKLKERLEKLVPKKDGCTVLNIASDSLNKEFKNPQELYIIRFYIQTRLIPKYIRKKIKKGDYFNKNEIIREYFEESILEGVKKYIPALKGSEVISVKFGVVKTPGGNIDHSNPESNIHKRESLGISMHEDSVLSVNAMKLIDGPIIGKLVRTIMNIEHMLSQFKSGDNNAWIGEARKELKYIINCQNTDFDRLLNLQEKVVQRVKVYSESTGVIVEVTQTQDNINDKKNQPILSASNTSSRFFHKNDESKRRSDYEVKLEEICVNFKVCIIRLIESYDRNENLTPDQRRLHRKLREADANYRIFSIARGYLDDCLYNLVEKQDGISRFFKSKLWGNSLEWNIVKRICDMSKNEVYKLDYYKLPPSPPNIKTRYNMYKYAIEWLNYQAEVRDLLENPPQTIFFSY